MSDIRLDFRTDKEKIWDLENEVRNLWLNLNRLYDRVYELEKKLREKEKEDGGENK